jgi:3-oxoacyl-[acyl-carrier-protein] synthase I
MSTSPRIVITGAGAVCGSGLDVAAIWAAIVDGRSAVAPIRQWDTTQWPANLAAEVNGVDNRTLVEDRKLHKTISRTDLFGLYAAGAAIRQSGLVEFRGQLDATAVAEFNDRCGVFAGSGGGNYQSHYAFLPLMTTAGGDLRRFGAELCATVNPMWLLKHLPNNVLCHVGIRHGFKGTNACITNHCAGGAMAVAEAACALRAAEADRAIAIGHDTPIEPETILHFHGLGLLAHDAVRSFDQHRSGTVLGEGAGAVLLELEEHARARGATIVGEFLGSGCVTEGTGVVDVRPDGSGLSRAIELALADAGVAASSVGMIVAHGNGTRASDASEAIALRRVFGDNLPPITAFKWSVGHLIAASGVVDLLLALTCLQRQVVPGIPTLRKLDPALAPLPVAATAQKPRGDSALVLCRGFGGMNVALLVRADPLSSALQ